LSLAAYRLDRWGSAVRSSCLALELDDVKPPQNVVEKEQRKSEDNNSDDEFADVKPAALLRIHWSPAFLRMVTFSMRGEVVSNQNLS